MDFIDYGIMSETAFNHSRSFKKDLAKRIGDSIEGIINERDYNIIVFNPIIVPNLDNFYRDKIIHKKNEKAVFISKLIDHDKWIINDEEGNILTYLNALESSVTTLDYRTLDPYARLSIIDCLYSLKN